MALGLPYYADDAVTLYHGDCYEIAPLIEGVDALITDPPYGMANDCDYTRFTKGGSKIAKRIHGDESPFHASEWLRYPSVVLWGYNHFASELPTGTTLVWLKRSDAALGAFLSDAEIAWSSGGCGVYCFRDTTMLSKQKRDHPTEKPVPLMRWVVERTTKPGDLILDPFMGSGPIARAAKDLGRRYVGIEIEERYCEAAARRCAQEVLL